MNLQIPYEGVLLGDDDIFNCDSQRIISLVNDEGYVVTCRHYDNTCKILKQSETEHLYFHKKMITTIEFMESENILFTASQDGTLVAWNISNDLAYVKWYAYDHNDTITTLDHNRELDLVATGSQDGKRPLFQSID